MDKKKSEAAEVFMASLSPRARAKFNSSNVLVDKPPPEVVDDEAETYGRAFMGTLSKAAQAALTRGAVPEPTPQETVTPKLDAKGGPKYGLVESEDGEWPKMHVFKNAEALARRLQQMEGKDVVAWAFYGIPLAITEGPQRYVVLPGGTALTVPMFDGGPVKVVDADTLDKLVIEEAGYLGPPELRTAMPTEAEAVVATPGGDE